MAATKSIAIIGATGNIGSAIANALSGNMNHRLLLMADDQDKLVELKMKIEKSGTEAYAMSCVTEASWEADIIIVSTPYEVEKEVARKISEVAMGKIVISVSNPLDKSYSRLATSTATSAAEELQKMLPGSKVVKTFNTTFAASFITPGIDGGSTDVFIAGNNSDAVTAVAALIQSAGFNPVIAGDLTVSRVLERMQLQLIQLAVKHNSKRLSGWKILHQ